MRELIRHILKENRLQQELKQVIEDNGIFDAIDMVGGLKNFKKVFKNDPEASQILDGLTGVVDFEIHDAFKDPRFVVFPIEYEIIGIEKNTWRTHSWPLLNLIYDDSKLTSAEKKKLITILATIQNDNTVGKIETNLPEIRNFGYFDVEQINGKNVDIHDVEFPFSKKDVIRIHNKLYGESESLNESSNESEKDLKKLLKITKMIMEDLILPDYNHIICSYEITLNEVFNIPEVTVLFIGGYGTKLWPMTQGIRQMYLDVLEDISKEIANYTGVVIGVRGEQTPKCEDKENSFLKESESEDKDYSPAGKEVTPNQIVVHKSNPKFRDKIMENGLKVRAGECYKIYVGYGVNCKPAIFATNSTNKRAWFDSTYDDDIWFIDTTKIPDVKWFKDRHFESRSKHIVTFQDIPKEAITLKYEGTGSSEDILNSWPEDSPNRKTLSEDSELVESENKSKNKKLKLVEKIIYDFFDEVKFIKVDTNYEEKPLIKIYYTTKDTAANYDSWFIEQIQKKIEEITGGNIIVCEYWAPNWDWRKKESDFYIDVEKINYDLMESENKSENKKLKLVKEMIYNLFDEVEFIEVDTNYEGKPLIIVYHDVENTAANYDSWFIHRIIDEIKEITGDGIILSPWWAAGWDWKYKNADLYIDVQKIKYDDEGNVINESDESKQERKFNKLIQNVEDYLNSNEYPSVKKFMLYYDEQFDDVIVNIFFDPVESVKLGGGINSVIKRVGKQVMEDLDIFPLNFKYHIHFDKNINESTEKKPKYLNIIKDLVKPFKDEDCVCDIRVLYNEEDDMYLIDLNMGTEELNDKFIAVIGMNHYVSKLRRDIKETIKDYLPIDNFYVGSYASPNCKWKPLNESDNKKQSLQKIIEKDGLYNFIEMSGLDFNQVKSILNKIDNPKKIIKQYIREYVLKHDGMSSENSGSLFGLKIRLSNTKLIYDIMVQDSDQIAVEIWEYYEDNYGQRITKDQYLTTINSLTNEELLSILSWMMETIQIGYWD